MPLSKLYFARVIPLCGLGSFSKKPLNMSVPPSESAGSVHVEIQFPYQHGWVISHCWQATGAGFGEDGGEGILGAKEV